MSIHINNFYSNVLQRFVETRVILPEPMDDTGNVMKEFTTGSKRIPTVWLLHGLGGDSSIWLRRTAIEQLATQYHVAVVMPQTERGFYTDMVNGPKYWTFLTQELPQRMQFIFPLSQAKEDNYLLGNSMGGYGALRWALTYPEKFNSVAVLSPVTNLSEFRNEQSHIMPDFDLAFDRNKLSNSNVDIKYLLDNFETSNSLRVMMSTGSDDILRKMDYESKEQFEKVFKDKFTWRKDDGQHNWTLWNKQLPIAMDWLFKEGE
ncbi:alpha/beta hydrolase [Companilactobacillus hulinensis]|uniref:alpha/beta hydrolase n=1 Tax=Companilactobacillus hulinensis TaxID=2486007 RepID=UPI000F777C6A|nr:alpha/beta fold hydrolase [Companilactobacillus hulinensis]